MRGLTPKMTPKRPGTGDLPGSKPYDIKGNWEEDFKTSGSF
jgi:hypothetical protein